MKIEPNPRLLAKAGTTALALCLMSGSVAAGMRCASSEELTALKVAALRQKLMVAALTCHQAGSFNRFVVTYQEKLVDSDHALMRFFVRQNSAHADDAYNAYKTRMANDFSLHSLKDPWFCESARASLDAALYHNASLAELVSDESRPIRTGYASCTADDADLTASPAAPNFPAHHAGMPDATPAGIDLAAKPAAAPLSSVPEQEASAETMPGAPPGPPPSADVAPQTDETANDESPMDDPQAAQNDYRQAYNGPYAPDYPYAAQPYPYSGPHWWYDAPRPMQQMQGVDGRWYLVPADGR